MSTKLSFKEALERRDGTADVRRVSSAFPVYNLVLVARGPINQPVDFIRTTVTHGLSLKKARQVLDLLAVEKPAAVELRADNLDQLMATLNGLGVDALVLVN